MTAATVEKPETMWVNDFGPVPTESLDLTSHDHDLFVYQLSDEKLKVLGEALAFAAQFESTDVYAAYADIHGDEGYITFEIKGNTKPQAIALRYKGDRWSAVDTQGAHSTSSRYIITDHEAPIAQRGVKTIFHAFLDEALLAKLAEELEISQEQQKSILIRINFKEKTYAFVASGEGSANLPATAIKTAIIPQITPEKDNTMSEQNNNTATQEKVETQEEAVEIKETEQPVAEVHAHTNDIETKNETHESPAAESEQEQVEAVSPTDETQPAAVEVEAKSEVVETNSVEETVEPAAETESTVEVDAHAPTLELPKPTSEPAAEAKEESAPAVAEEKPSVEPVAEVQEPKQEEAVKEAEAESKEQAEPPKADAQPEKAAEEAKVEKQEHQNKPEQQDKNEQNRNQNDQNRDRNKGNQNRNDQNQNQNRNDQKRNDRPAENQKNDRSQLSQIVKQNQPERAQQAAKMAQPERIASMPVAKSVDAWSKYESYSKSEVDNLIKRNSESVTKEVISKLSNRESSAKEAIKEQEHQFKQAMTKLSRSIDDVNSKLDKVSSELNSGKGSGQDAKANSVAKELEDLKATITKKVLPGMKLLDGRLEQLVDVKKAPSKKDQPAPAATNSGGLSPSVLTGFVVAIVIVAAVNLFVTFYAMERISNLEKAQTDAAKVPAASSTTEVPMPDLMNQQK